MKRLAEILQRMKEIKTEMEDADEKRLAELETEVDELLEEKRKFEARQKALEDKFDEGMKTELNLHDDDPKPKTRKDEYDSKEYRKAFMDYVMKGSKDIKKFHRADATTDTDDIGEVIPTTVLNRIIEELEDYGEIFPLVTKTSYPGGVDIPTSSAKPTASWTAEGSVADKQKKSTGKITFSYYKLQIRVATTLVASIVSLDVFENTISGNIAEAMAVAIEDAILEGSGSGEPLGIMNDTDIPADNVVDFETTDGTYEGWLTKLVGNIPLAYRKKKKGRIIMNSETFDTYVWGLKDDNGQPIARMTYGLDGQIVYRLLGYEVVLNNTVAALNASTANEAVVAIYVDLSDYMFNTNMQITTRRYFDEDTDEWVQKSTMIADGRLSDTYGVVLLQTPEAG